jgi:uncharacterized protein YkwD
MRAVVLVVCVLTLAVGFVSVGALPLAEEPTGTPSEAAPTPEHPATPSSSLYDVDVDQIEDLIHQKMNDRRQENGLEPLERNETLDQIAQYKSWDMAQRDYFAHTGPNGTTFGMLRDRYEARCENAGQNLAKHRFDPNREYPYPQSELSNPEEISSGIVRGLLNSPGHRANALSPHYDSQGIGVFVDENGTVFVTQEFCG